MHRALKINHQKDHALSIVNYLPYCTFFRTETTISRNPPPEPSSAWHGRSSLCKLSASEISHTYQIHLYVVKQKNLFIPRPASALPNSLACPTSAPVPTIARDRSISEPSVQGFIPFLYMQPELTSHATSNLNSTTYEQSPHSLAHGSTHARY
jgi:hypothetical protein